MNSKELARILGVSQATISRALNDSPRVLPETKKRIVEKAKEYGFELNSQAQSLKTNRTGTIGILFSEHFRGMTATPMLAHFYDSLQHELIKYDYDIMLIYDYAPTSGTSVFERIIRRRKVDGLITIRTTLRDREMSLIRENNFPCVFMLMTREIPGGPYTLYSDGEHGGNLAGRFLGAFADYEPVYVGFNGAEEESNRRCEGFTRGLAAAGRKLPAACRLSCPMTFEAGYAIAKEWIPTLSRRKIAVYTYNDLIALGIFNALQEAGVNIPGQVQIIGTDDIPQASWVTPKLSTLHVAVEEIVPDGCKLLTNLIDGHNVGHFKSSYEPRLILRDTTAPLPT